jgi:hypothetical protein
MMIPRVVSGKDEESPPEESLTFDTWSSSLVPVEDGPTGITGGDT